MALSATALGLISTAALLSLYRMPGFLSSRNSHNSYHETNPALAQIHKRYLSQRQYHEPPPARFSLDRFVNHIFRRPYLADVRPSHYRKPRPYRPIPLAPGPIWPSLPKSPSPLSSNTYYTYSQYGLPVMSKNSVIPTKANGNVNKAASVTQSPKKMPNSKQNELSSEVDDRDDQDEEDDDYDDHYYTEDFNPFEGPFHEDSKKESKEKKGDDFYYQGRQEKKLKNDARNASKNTSEEYMANPSKKTYAYSKKGKSTTTTTQATTTKDCSPGPKVNYHYHMYMVKQMAGQKKKKAATKKPSTTTEASVYPVYETQNMAESSHKFHTSGPTYGSLGHSDVSVAYTSQIEMPSSVITFQGKPKGASSDYYYQVVTSSSYIEPSDSYVHMTSTGDGHKSQLSQKPGSHFNSDYYNSVLLTKILGLNTNAKAMPIENYATEPSRTAPLANFDYKNSKSVESSKLFEMDENSKLYVTKGKKAKGNEGNNKKQHKSKH